MEKTIFGFQINSVIFVNFDFLIVNINVFKSNQIFQPLRIEIIFFIIKQGNICIKKIIQNLEGLSKLGQS